MFDEDLIFLVNIDSNVSHKTTIRIVDGALSDPSNTALRRCVSS